MQTVVRGELRAEQVKLHGHAAQQVHELQPRIVVRGPNDRLRHVRALRLAHIISLT